MTDTLAPETLEEKQVRISQMIADASLALAQRNLAEADTRKREQDIFYAPWFLLASGAAGMGALIGAIVAILKWLQH